MKIIRVGEGNFAVITDCVEYCSKFRRLLKAGTFTNLVQIQSENYRLSGLIDDFSASVRSTLQLSEYFDGELRRIYN